MKVLHSVFQAENAKDTNTVFIIILQIQLLYLILLFVGDFIVKVTSSFGYDLECSDPVCCADSSISIPEDLTVSFTHYRYLFRPSVELLLGKAVKNNGSDYAFSIRYSGGRSYQLQEIGGLANTDKCVWNVYLEDKLVAATRALICKVSVGGIASFRYEERRLHPHFQVSSLVERNNFQIDFLAFTNL